MRLLDVHIEGQQSVLALLGVSTDTADVFLPAAVGTLLVPPGTTTIVSLGPLPPGGVLDLSLPIPALPAGLESLQVFGQVAHLDPLGLFAPLGTASAVTILDDAL